MSNPFAPATKRSARARVAFDGPSGSGKTWTALEWATVLAEGGRIAYVDTERGSASLYAARFDFDVIEMQPPYHPHRLLELVQAAEANGYPVLVIDSLTHFWNGEGGVLDIVDNASTRTGGNSFAAWKEGSPVQREMVDGLLAADMHLIVTMRSKQEWVLEENERGKKVPRRVGMAPEQRAGLEYEMTMVGDLDLTHTLVFSKSRCDRLADEVVKPGAAAEAAEVFRSWLEDGEPLADRTDVDQLVQEMNKLPDSSRSDCKRKFVQKFGRPDRLIAAQVEDARAFVAAHTARHAANLADIQAALDRPILDDQGQGDVGYDLREDDHDASPDRETVDDRLPMRRLFALLRDIGIDDNQRHEWASSALDRTVTSFTELDAHDLEELTTQARMAKESA